jgi:nucleotide-binding universal stress UspA family protein
MYHHLLVPIDGTEAAQAAMRSSLALAHKLGARVTGFVVEVDDPLAFVGRHPTAALRDLQAADAKAADHAQHALQAFADLAQAAGVPFQSHFVRSLQVDEAIVAAAQSLGCDLIVMATHGRGVLGELLFGSHTKGVLARSQLPLLVLH